MFDLLVLVFHLCHTEIRKINMGIVNENLLSIVDCARFSHCMYPASPRTPRNLVILLNFVIFRQFIQNSDLPCKYANMFTLFRMALLKIRRQGYLVQEITKPGEICYSCKETRFFVLILELDSPSRKHGFENVCYTVISLSFCTFHESSLELTNKRRIDAKTRRMPQ